MIKSRQPGDNITLMNTMFFRVPDPANNKLIDNLAIVYKDLDSGLKYVEEIQDPDYEYYICNPDKRVNYNRLFISKDDAVSVTVPYKDLEKDIAKRVGMLDFFYENIKNGNRSENKKLHLHPDVFNSDTNIEDHYRYRFDKLYQNQGCSISKAFFDIESDTIEIEDRFPEPGECPVNAISLIVQETRQVYVFLLRNKNNPLIEEFEKTVIDGSIFQELADFIIQAVGGPSVAQKYDINFNYNFLFYDEEDEINLITDFFTAINTFKPDFALAWNMSFDMPYLIERIIKLGHDPREIMCHKDFKNKMVMYFIDERVKSDFQERGDFAIISSYTTYLDQLIHFASRRKGQSKFTSFGLDYIGEQIAKVRKLDFRHITDRLVELPYKNYKTFVFYNIMDTIVQYCIEKVTGDIDYVFNKSLMNNTRYSKTHRQTVYLANRGIKELNSQNFIIGNNVNKYNPKPTSKFPGAFVAEPRQLNNHAKMVVYGRVIDVLNNLVDFDYSALYPSILRQMNIAPNTQIGMLIIATKVHDKENRSNRSTWTRASSFMEDFQSQVWLEINSRWLHLADYTTLYYEIINFFTSIASATNGMRYYDRNGLIIPVDIENNNRRLVEPMIFEDKRRKVEEIYIQPDFNRWEEWRNAAIRHPNQQF